VAWFDEDGDGLQTDELKAFYCISTNIKQTVLALCIKTNTKFYFKSHNTGICVQYLNWLSRTGHNHDQHGAWVHIPGVVGKLEYKSQLLTIKKTYS